MLILLPFITLMMGSLLAGINKNVFLKYSLFALSAAGFCVTILGVLVWPYYDQFYLVMKEKIDFTPTWNMLSWDPLHSPIILHAKILYENYVPNIPVQAYFHTEWHWVNYGLVPCPVDNYIYCTYGALPALAVLVLVGVMMAVILRQVNVLKRRTRIFTSRSRAPAPTKLNA